MTAEREFYDGEVVPGTRYRVICLLGAGGMGSVYEVEHSELGKRFVLKALLRGLTNRDDLVRRLRNEWRALGQLEHPNIVSVTDAGVTSSGIPYFVMERLMGETLSARIRRERRLRVHDALLIAAEVLDGLSAAHSLGIVHRDVKPPNVFLVKNRPAKLLDFGIAKMLDPKASQITGRGIAIGTPRYMSPEQTTGAAVDARSDLYSTGIILFEMIAGAGPFDQARDGNELFLAQLTQPAPPVSRFVPVPPELDSMLARLLAKKPAERPASAALVAAEFRTLARALKNEPVPESPPPDDVTLPGGPFDTLEGAATVPNEGLAPAGDEPRRSSRTLVGIAAPPARPPMPSDSGGPTLRLDLLEPTEGATTHTALPRPEPIVQTPPPAPPAVPSVVSMQVATPRPRRRALAIAAAIGACSLAAGVVIASRRAAPADDARAATARAPVGASSSLAPGAVILDSPERATEAPPAEKPAAPAEPASLVPAAPPPVAAALEERPGPVVAAPPRALAPVAATPKAAPAAVARPAAAGPVAAKKPAKTASSAGQGARPEPERVVARKAPAEPGLPSSGL